MVTCSDLPFDETQWIIRIRRILEEEIELGDDQPVSIFDVLKPLLCTKPEAYVPQLVALGPYHHCRQGLRDMEMYKLSAAKRAQSHLPSMKFQQLVDVFATFEHRIRSHYHRQLNLTDETLAWMMAIDVSFLLEFLQTFCKSNNHRTLQRMPSRMSHLVDPSHRTSVHSMLLRDIVMLENQIPMFLLVKVVEMWCLSGHSIQRPNLSSMLSGFFQEEIAVPSITQLAYVGVTFTPTAGSISTIEFCARTATLHLPVISIDMTTEVVLRNLVAYEASIGSRALVFARYVELMNGIIDTDEDARLLREHGIILNHLKSDQEVAELWNGMTWSVRLTRVPALDRVIDELNRYHGACWKVRVRAFVKAHLLGSRDMVACAMMVLLLLFVGVQAFCLSRGCLLSWHGMGMFLRMIFEEDPESTSEKSDQEHALAKGVDVMVMSLSSDTAIDETTKEGDQGPSTSSGMAGSSEKGFAAEDLLGIDKLSLDDVPATHHRKMTLLFTLLSACVADKPVSQEEDDRKSSHFRKGYDARHRVALRLLATWLDVKWVKMEAIEVMVACSAMAAAKEQEQSGENASPKSKWAKWKRGGIIGAAALTGGALLAITGGLAAPAIAAGFGALAPTLGTIMPVIGASGFAAMATAAGSVAGSVAVAASFGAAGAGLTGTKMARRIGSVKEFEFKPIGENHNQGRLAVGILVSGFAFDEEDYIRPWEGWKDNLERYILQWESKHIIAVSTAIQDWLTSRLALELMKQGAMRTVLSGFLAAFAWPATLLAATDFIDSKWSVAIDRSDKAGKMLAEVLMKGSQGNRPVTLIGFSLGARVIFKCLQELALSSDNEGLVERVVLLGAPVSVKGERWEPARKMVAGRFVNVYSKDDWILGVTFRASLLTQGLAGIQAVDVPGVENVDVTELVDGHSSYLSAAQLILKHLELNTYYPVFVPLPTAVSK
ncbi:unnamed protein product [Triticum turgidum subsp. durum]|uniref:Transmembrane and coiled-coil domain-containing protein 4 n=1 Tax=Triticum turgidum subsp. durum TaxID=4567 RepID=A0A9R0TDK1_TRITD|nr:unnamed protein product [Triticum turgidum subsp. durum]